jgi:alpha-mannosidase
MWQEMTGDQEMLFLYGRGDHGGGPRAGDFEALEALRADPTAPRCVHATPQAYFEVLAVKDDLPVHRGELGGGFTGSCSSEGRAKQRNRHMEHLLLAAERFATFAMFLQRKPSYPRVDLQDAWRAVLHHQFHDELPGTSRAPVYRDNDADYDRVQALAEGIVDDALAEIAARIDTRGAGVPIVVHNPLAWSRSEPVRLTLRLSAQPDGLVVHGDDDQAVPALVHSVHQEGHYWYADLSFLARDIPALGYRLFRAWPTARAEASGGGVSVSEARDVIVLQNDELLATIDRRTGHVISVHDKRVQREVLSGGGYALQVIPETPGESTAWIIALEDEVEVLRRPESVEVVRAGPLHATVRIAYRYRDSFLAQEVTLSDGVPRLDVRLQVEWYERDCCLKAAFPTAMTAGSATFEAPLGAIVRPMDGAEVPAQRWIDVSDEERGASLLNDCRYAFDVAAGCMRMTIVRGIPDLDPEADVGHHDLHYALHPHEGDWRIGDTVREGWAFNMPLIARQALRRAGVIAPWIAPGVNHAMPPTFSFLQVAPSNVALTAFKLEDEDWGPGSPLVIRLYETAGQPTTATISFAAPLMHIEETNHLEQAIESNALHWEGDTARVAFRGHEIKTFRLQLAVPAFAIYEGLAHRADVAPGETPGFEGG